MKPSIGAKKSHNDVLVWVGSTCVGGIRLKIREYPYEWSFAIPNETNHSFSFTEIRGKKIFTPSCAGYAVYMNSDDNVRARWHFHEGKKAPSQEEAFAWWVWWESKQIEKSIGRSAKVSGKRSRL